MQTILLNFFTLTGATIIRIPLVTLSTALLARTIGPEGMGIWAMVLAAATFLYSLILSWIQAPNIRFGREEWTLHRRLSDTWSARWPIVFIGIGLATLFLFFQPFSFLQGLFNLETTWWPLVLVLFLGRWFLAETQSLYRITDKIRKFAIIPIAIESLIIIFLVALVYFSPASKIKSTIIGMVFIMTLIPAGAWIEEFKFTKSGGVNSRSNLTRKIFKYGYPLLPGLLFSFLSNWGDHVLIQYFRSTREVGLFNSGYQAMTALAGLSASISILLLPRLIDKKLSDRGAERDYLMRVSTTAVSLWLLMIIPLLVVIPWVFRVIFGSEFDEAIPILLILLATIPGSIFPALYSILFETQGRLGRSSLFTGVMFGVNFIISLALVAKFGGIGAAVGTAISHIVKQFLYVLDQHRFLGISKEKVIVFLIFSLLYGLVQIAMGDELGYRIGGAFLGFSCLILMIRQYKMVDKAILEGLFSGKLSSFHPPLYRLLIRNVG